MDEIHGLDQYLLSLYSSICLTNIYLHRELQSFGPEAHWFCPRQSDEDLADYDNPDEADEDATPEMKQKAIEEGKHRHGVAYKFSLILGMADEVSGRLCQAYLDKLNALLASCDTCVYNWHMGRKAYLGELSE